MMMEMCCEEELKRHVDDEASGETSEELTLATTAYEKPGEKHDTGEERAGSEEARSRKRCKR